jgi:hypothetical protein
MRKSKKSLSESDFCGASSDSEGYKKRLPKNVWGCVPLATNVSLCFLMFNGE